MNEDKQESKPRTNYLRYAVFSLAALLVLSLGFALVPADPPVPAAPPFSEQARASALQDALALRASALELASANATAVVPTASVQEAVTLLTLQARALLRPEADSSPAPASGSPGPESPGLSPEATEPGTPSAVELAKAVAASGARRLQDAEKADGGIARLLAGAGTAQLLAARKLAADAGEPGALSDAGATAAAPAGPASPADTAKAADPTTQCPTPSPSTAGTGGSASSTGATAAAAVAAALRAEQEAVYGYEAAMSRLAPAEAGPASEYLKSHRDLMVESEAWLRGACGAAAPQEPGYVLDAGFLAAPAGGLGKLEATAVVSYGDLVAFSQGALRAWALTALQSATVRAQHWGADSGPVPGLVLDTAQLPDLPAGTAVDSTAPGTVPAS